MPPEIKIAVTAWDWKYTATCLDSASVKEFALAHYANGLNVEQTCKEGEYPEEPGDPPAE
jgi:hypothetical protein